MIENEQPRIERPVTMDILKRLAEEGDPALMHMAIQYAERPLLATEGASLVNMARRVQAARWEAEENRLIGILHLSDDPGWQSLLTPRINELYERMSASNRRADKVDGVIGRKAQEGADLA